MLAVCLLPVKQEHSWAGYPGLIGVSMIHNKTICMLALVSNIFHGSFNKFYACFCMPIALMVVR